MARVDPKAAWKHFLVRVWSRQRRDDADQLPGVRVDKTTSGAAMPGPLVGQRAGTVLTQDRHGTVRRRPVHVVIADTDEMPVNGAGAIGQT